MKKEVIIRSFKAGFFKLYRFIWQQKGLWLRASLCWLIGLFFVLADSEPYFDLRLKLRGLQPYENKIVLLHLTSQDWSKAFGSNNSSLTDVGTFENETYWSSEAWSQILEDLLAENPLVIGVSPYLGKKIPLLINEMDKFPVFKNANIVWALQLDEDGQQWPQQLPRKSLISMGVNDHRSDRDGIYRRFRAKQNKLPHFAVQIEKRMNLDGRSSLNIKEDAPVINFRGEPNTFTQIRLKDFIQKNYPTSFLKNKVVLIGVQDEDGLEHLTPMGRMSRVELLANIIDNIHYQRWINQISLFWIAIILLFFVLLSAWITSNYPQVLAVFLLSFCNVLYITISLWVFDYYYVWTPILAVVIVSGVTYITFLSFQLTLKEYLNTQLENEKRFLFEVEELKNNFLSLISHDLKNPIAKIQAICDRLMAQYSQHEFTSDILSLREISTELHRYIKTILHITRVESRDFRISKDATDINEIVEAVVQQLEPLAKNKKISIRLELEPMFLIEADHVLIHEVILNIIENAIKYSPDESVVKITTQEVDDNVLVMVEDAGPGISEDEQQKIFEKFYRGEISKLHTKGSGLGLYLVKYFVELHHGKILLESQPKKGTKIGFSLPLHEHRETGSASSGEVKNEN